MKKTYKVVGGKLVRVKASHNTKKQPTKSNVKIIGVGLVILCRRCAGQQQSGGDQISFSE